MLRPLTTLILLIATCAPEPGTQTGIRPADLVLLDGRVVTVDDRFRMSTALAVRDGRFVAVGSNEDARAHIGSTTRVIDGPWAHGDSRHHRHPRARARRGGSGSDAAIPEPAIHW